MMDDDDLDDLLEDLDGDGSIGKLVDAGYRYFWSNTELTYDKNLKVVRSKKQRVQPPTWFCYMNEDERDRITK